MSGPDATVGERGADPFRFDDAAYVLGALDADDRAAFEAHLRTCAECTARVAELRDVPAALAAAGAWPDPDEAPPDTLLPGLLRRASARQRRQRWAVGALVAVAAACMVALVVSLWPTGSGSGPAPRAAASSSQVVAGPLRAFTPLVHGPVLATANLTAKRWGTEIDLTCVYRPSTRERGTVYEMFVFSRDNERYGVGGWKQPTDRDVKYATGTALTLAQISKIEITLPDGTPILRLTN